MIKNKTELEDYLQKLKDDKYLQNAPIKISRVENAIKLFGKKVNVPEYGKGKIVAIEVFKEYWAEQRYLIEITENTAKPILKSMFPDNIMAFWLKDFTIIN